MVFSKDILVQVHQSTQILTEPDGLGTTTYHSAHYGKGLSIGEMTLIGYIWSSSSSTFLCNGIGTLRAVYNKNGAALCLSFIVCSSASVLKPLNRLG